MDSNVIEQLAAFAHERWAGWVLWMLENWDATHDSGEPFRDRWRRQAETAYADLPDKEMDSDRQEAVAWMNRLGVSALTPSVTGWRRRGCGSASCCSR